MKIVMLEPINISNDQLKNYKNKLEDQGHQFISYDNRVEDENEIIERTKDADIIIITNLPLSKNIINSCPCLKMISVAFTGVDHIDLEACKQNNITVCNSSGYANQGVAELTFGLIISLLRKMKKCDQAVRKGKTRKGLIGNELAGKTMGIIGTGEIGLKVAQIAKAFSCNLLGYDKVEKDTGKEIGIKYMELEQLLKESDIVSLHVPLTSETESMISEKHFSLMKNNSIFINTARGPIVDSKALADALKNNKIAAAGVDVFEMEPPIPEEHPLLNVPNIILAPHVAFATEEAFLKRAKIVFENIDKWLKGKPQNKMV